MPDQPGPVVDEEAKARKAIESFIYSIEGDVSNVLSTYYSSRILNLLQAVSYITDLPPQALSATGFANLQRLTRHFEQGRASTSPIVLDTEDVEPNKPSPAITTGTGTAATLEKRQNRAPVVPAAASSTASPPTEKGSVGPPRKSGEGSKYSSAYHNHYGLLMAVENFRLEKTIKNHLDDNATHDPVAFLEDAPPTVSASFPNLEEFPEFCRAVDKMPMETIMASVRRLFLLLAVGEIALHFSTKPRLKQTIIKHHDEAEYESISGTLRGAWGVGILCEKFNTGCLFWLAPELNDFVYVSPAPAIFASLVSAKSEKEDNSICLCAGPSLIAIETRILTRRRL